MKKNIGVYLGVAFGWTWICWIGAFLIGMTRGSAISFSSTAFETLQNLKNTDGWIQGVFAVGVYGPLLGYVLSRGHQKKFFTGKLPRLSVILALSLPVIMALPGIIASLIARVEMNRTKSLGATLLVILVYFVSNVLTSGTEEFGWRGVLYTHLREKESTFWSAAWKGGFIWAIWHYPMMIMLYWGQSAFVVIPSLIGFTAGIVAMNYISNFIFERSQSIPLLAVMHGLNNTVGFVLLLLFPLSPFTILTHLMAWAVVIYLEKKFKPALPAQTVAAM
ncbi:MAG: CPBP family intramembrane glutamic endopeptidase [Clostridiaceae bacterium]